MKNICIYGASSTQLDPSFYVAGEELGREIAKRGYGMVFGGGAQGMMGATARGMTQMNGHIIGVTPRFFEVDGIIYDHCTELIYTHTMRERKRTMEEKAHAFITTPGGIGTFEEFFEILTLKQLKRHKKAMVVYNINGYFDELLRMIDMSVEKNFTLALTKKLYFVAHTAGEAIDYIDGYEFEDFEFAGVRFTGDNE